MSCRKRLVDMAKHSGAGHPFAPAARKHIRNLNVIIIGLDRDIERYNATIVAHVEALAKRRQQYVQRAGR